MDDLKEILAAATPGPWALDEGGEVHKSGTTIFAWPKWSDQSNHGVIYANMSLGSLAPDLAAEVLRLRAGLQGICDFLDASDDGPMATRDVDRLCHLAFAALKGTG